MPIETDRVHLLKPTAVNSILSEVRLLQSQGRQLVSLMRGEPDFATPPHIVRSSDARFKGRADNVRREPW